MGLMSGLLATLTVAALPSLIPSAGKVAGVPRSLSSSRPPAAEKATNTHQIPRDTKVLEVGFKLIMRNIRNKGRY